MCRLAELTLLGGAVVATGMAVGGVVDPCTAVGSGALVATGVAVAEEPQAMMNTRSIEINTAGFLRLEIFMTQPPCVGITEVLYIES